VPATSLPAPRRFGETTRRDAWWLPSLVVFLGFSAFILYSTWAAYSNAYYEYGPYLSPMYSPLLFGPSAHAWFGGPAQPVWWPSFLRYSAAALILWGPVGFRLTCYYYRGAYYKAFWADPPSCSVGEPRQSYLGENAFPLILQNVHRYFLYLALIFIVILTYDVWVSLWFADPATGAVRFGVGVGTIVLAVNVVLLAGYTFGCHSLRHLVGGARDEISRSRLCATSYACASALNRRHMLFAWTSLFSVALADLYVRLCSMGVITDVRIL